MGLIPAGGVEEKMLARAVATYAESAPSRNLTLQAIADAELAEGEKRTVVGQVPFSSRRRWSALDLGEERLILGAPERCVRGCGAGGAGGAARRGPGAVSWLGRSRAPLPADEQEPAFRDVQALGLVVLAERLGRTPPTRSPSSPTSRSTSRCSPATRRRPSARSPTTQACRDRRRRWTARRSRPSRRRCARRSWPHPPSAASRRMASGPSWTR